ncbi:MAG: glycosyltransferase family 39 protein [Acidobacteriia bacterium]|nr:glycosyltransferase family 39 protein [Terriglobia bacterium]
MKLRRENLLALMLLCAVLAVNVTALWPELSISRVDLNDNVFHFTLIERMVQAVERGESPLDNWSPEWTLGYPVLRTYQPLSHALVALVYFALRKSVDLMTVFVWVRFLSLVLLPASFYVTARLMGLPSLTAAASAMLAPLISTNFLYGVEFGSYTWAGSGLFPQAVASHLFLITLGLAFQAVRKGRRFVLTGAMLGLTCMAHLIYGYMAALSIVLLAVLPDAEVGRRVRILRTLLVGSTAVMLAAFQLVPLILDAGNINHSRWEPVWKWDSFGAEQGLKWLFTGELLDHGRWPVLTALAFASAGLFVWTAIKRRPTCAIHQFVVAGAALWTVMFFGRSFWGPLLTMLGVPADMQLHRVIGGAQIFLVLLASIGLAAIWREVAQRWHVGVAAAATVLLFYPMVRERAVNLSNNAEWGRKNLAAYEANRQFLEVAISEARQQGGRAYAGLAAAWGGQFKIGDVPFYAFLSEANVPAVAFLYHAMALTSDIMVRFNEWNPIHYQLFNIRTVVAPAGVPLPPFLIQRQQVGPFRILDAPGSSYFDVVDVLASVKTNRNNFYDLNDRWLQSDWTLKHAYLWLDRRGDAPPQLPRLAPDEALPQMPFFPPPGQVERERRDGETYRASIDVNRPSFALFKMTWHANWKAYIDGKPETTAMLSPGFIGVSVPAGRHDIVMRYEPDIHKGLWGIAGLIGVLLLLVCERRGLLAGVAEWTVPVPLVAVRRRFCLAGGLILLALPVCLPLFTGRVLWGHDGFVYFPRLVEVHENILHGNLLPRWAPDLGRGTGQPLFLFHPPMIYLLGEFWHLLGFDFVAAMNIACAVVVLASAVAIFLLARLYFGDYGGWLGAAALLYAPYFAVDLYVRSAMEEFAAFPFLALTLYGFGAYAKHGARKYWMLGVTCYAAVLFCHFPAALLFTPLLLAFLGVTAWVEKSWTILWRLAAGFSLGLGIAACVWLPALAARQHASMSRAVEGNGEYSNHFVYLHQLFYSPWGYGLSVPGPDDGMSFALGWSHLLLALLALLWISRKTKSGASVVDGRLLWFFAVASAILGALMLQEAHWFWEQIPILQNVQLPWRLLGPVAVCVAFLVAPLGKLLESAPGWKRMGMVAAMALLILPNLAHLHAGRTADVDLTFWTPQQLAQRGFETTTMAEVTPRWITGLPPYRPSEVMVLSGDADVASPGRSPFRWTSRVNAKAASTLEMSTAWFPGWDAQVDGQSVSAGPGIPSGLLTFQVPPGEHTVQVSFGRTRLEKIAVGISITSLMLAIACCGIGKRSRWG